jgi:hypothetical protein
MVFSAEAAESTTRLMFALPFQRFAYAYFAVFSEVAGDPYHFLAHLVFHNVSVER